MPKSKKQKKLKQKFIRATDVVEGSDQDVDDLAEALRNLADAVEMNDELHIGNVEWLERQAAAMRYAFEH